MHVPLRYRGIKLRESTSTGELMIIDFDSHLREGYFMDEVYKLDGPYERFRPVKLNDGRTHNTKFLHSLDPISPQGHAAHRHPYIYDPKTNWRGGDVAARQVGGDVAPAPIGLRVVDIGMPVGGVALRADRIEGMQKLGVVRAAVVQLDRPETL